MSANDDSTAYASDVAFSPTVKAIQARKGSRDVYAAMEQAGGWRSEISDDLARFIAAQTSVFLGTVNAQGHPYIQHRGGPEGFLKVLDPKTIGFADFAGNRQYVTAGNLSDNPKAHLFLMDYANRQRIKIWGTARVVEDDHELVDRLMPGNYRARPEHAVLFTVDAWDANCPSHIPRRIAADEFVALLAERDQRIADLEAELRQLHRDVTDAGLSDV